MGCDSRKYLSLCRLSPEPRLLTARATMPSPREWERLDLVSKLRHVRKTVHEQDSGFDPDPMLKRKDTSRLRGQRAPFNGSFWRTDVEWLDGRTSCLPDCDPKTATTFAPISLAFQCIRGKNHAALPFATKS